MANQSFGVDLPVGDGTKILEGLLVRRVECGPLPADTTPVNTAHGITALTLANVVAVFGTATDGTTVIPLSRFHATAATAVRVDVTATNVVVTAGGNLSAFTVATVYIVYR